MLNLQEIEEAIAELEAGKTSFSACSKLADLYVVRDRFKRDDSEPETKAYSSASEPQRTITRYSNFDTVGDYGDSEFLIAIYGKSQDAVWNIIDELMDAIKVLQPRIYDQVLRKLDMAD